MQIYRIALAKYAHSLTASGRIARWNPNEVFMIYTASSRSLACLENVVHRSQLGLNMLFSVMTIEVPDQLKTAVIKETDLPADWRAFEQQGATQNIGARWIAEGKTVLLKVPSAIIAGEFNYLINPGHADFGKIKLVSVEPFVFDPRIKN